MFTRPSGPSKTPPYPTDTCKPVGLRATCGVNVSNGCTTLGVSLNLFACLVQTLHEPERLI